MKHYRALSALLLYPEQELIDSLAEIEEVFSGLPFVATGRRCSRWFPEPNSGAHSPPYSPP